MKCQQCNAVAPTDSKFCPECGNPIDKTEKPTESSDVSIINKKPHIFWLYLIGIALVGYYTAMLIPAFDGQIIAPQSGLGPTLGTGLFFYIWWKRRGRNAWIGATIGSIIAILFFFMAALIGGYISQNDNQLFLSKFQNSVTQLADRQNTINKKLFSSPQTNKDIKGNISTLEEYLMLINDKRNTYKEFIDHIEKYGSRIRDKHLINNVDKFKNDILMLFDLSEKSTINLINYYKTNNEYMYSEYVKLMSQVNSLEEQCRASYENLLPRINNK